MSTSGRRESSAAGLLVMRGQIKENEAIIKELETSWEDKLKVSESQLDAINTHAKQLSEALERSNADREKLEKDMDAKFVVVLIFN